MDVVSTTSTSSTPALSVILPVHNGARYLNEAIESIRSQTFSDFELLVLDDGSTDESWSIAQHHAHNDPRVKVTKLDRWGLTPVLNFGLGRAQAPWIARMDADDIAHPYRFEKQMSFLEKHPTTAVLGTFAWLMGPTGKALGTSTLGPVTHEDYVRLRGEVRINFVHPTVIYSKVIVLQSGGYSDMYPAAEDFELWNRLADTCSVRTLPEPLLYYRVHDSSTGTSSMRTQTESWAHVRENTRRRRAGLKTLSVEEFRALRRSSGLSNRLRRELRLLSRYAYRRAGARITTKKLSGLGWLFISAAFYPPVPFERMRSQFIRPSRLNLGISRFSQRFVQ